MDFLPFDELCQLLDADDFEASAARLMRRLDLYRIGIGCFFYRGESSAQPSHDPYRRAVERIPRMDRAEERRFCMGLELMRMRLRKAMRAANLCVDHMQRDPELTSACAACLHGDVPDPEVKPNCPANCVDSPLDEESLEMRKRLSARCAEFTAVRNELIERNLYIVFRLLARYRGVGVSEEDMTQEANASLFRAVEGFDFRRGVRFRTYATFWVNQAFLNAIYNQSRIVRVPAYIQKAMKKLRDAHTIAGEDPFDTASLAAAAKIPEELARTAMTGNRYTSSLDRVVDDEEGMKMVDLFEDESSGIDYESFDENRLEEHLTVAIDALTAREQRILQMRFGLGGEQVHTLAQTGERLEISLERVRQIQEIALEKIRCSEKRGALEEYNL